MRAFRIQISSIYLRSDGSADGLPCELTLSNEEDLRLNFVGNSYKSASGKTITQVVPSGHVEFEIKLTKLYSSVYQELITAANENLAAQAGTNDLESISFPVEITGYSVDENLTFDAIWNPAKPFSRARFIDGGSFDITLRLIKI